MAPSAMSAARAPGTSRPGHRPARVRNHRLRRLPAQHDHRGRLCCPVRPCCPVRLARQARRIPRARRAGRRRWPRPAGLARRPRPQPVIAGRLARQGCHWLAGPARHRLAGPHTRLPRSLSSRRTGENGMPARTHSVHQAEPRPDIGRRHVSRSFLCAGSNHMHVIVTTAPGGPDELRKRALRRCPSGVPHHADDRVPAARQDHYHRPAPRGSRRIRPLDAIRSGTRTD